VDAARGTLEGYVAERDVRALAALKGAGTLAQSLRPHTNAGEATSQGIPFQRIDQGAARHRRDRHHRRRTVRLLRHGADRRHMRPRCRTSPARAPRRRTPRASPR